MARAERADPGLERSLAGRIRALGQTLQRIPRALAVVLVLGWAALIWFASSRPAPAIESGGPWGHFLANLAHAPEYGVLVVWLALARPRRDGWPELGPRAGRWILLAALAYAVLDEIHQSFTPHRDASVFDVVTDLAGASATLACIVAAGRARAGSRELLVRLVLGLLACLLAATLATFAPEAWPDAAWL